MTLAPPDPVDSLVARLVDHHGFAPPRAVVILRRAALRKGVTLDVLAARATSVAPTATVV